MVIKDTFTNGLSPWLKMEVDALGPVGLARMMKLALKMENGEMVWKEIGLVSVCGSKVHNYLTRLKDNTTVNTTTVQGGRNMPMRTITFKGVMTCENRMVDPIKQLLDAKFQSRREKRLCFQCEEKYYARHRCKAMEQKEL